MVGCWGTNGRNILIISQNGPSYLLTKLELITSDQNTKAKLPRLEYRSNQILGNAVKPVQIEGLVDYFAISYPKDSNNLGRIDIMSVIDLSLIISFYGNPGTNFNIG